MVLLVHAVQRPFGVHGQAVQLPAETYGEVADVDHFLHLPPAFLQAFAHFVAHQSAQRVFMVAKGLAVLPHDFPAAGGRNAAPVLKGIFRRPDDLVVLLAGRNADPADEPAVDGRVAFNVLLGVVHTVLAGTAAVVVCGQAKLTEKLLFHDRGD